MFSLLAIEPVGDAAAEVVEAFEGPEPSWSLVDADCPAHLATHARQFKHAYRGQGCEYLKVMTGQGTYAYLSHDIQPSPVIDELAVSVWVKSDRPGIQLRLRVVLPRTQDERTGKPMTTFLVGTTYQGAGRWQQLAVERPMLLLQRQQAVLRLQFGQRVDVRQAYVDRVVLNAHGGGSTTNLWIDDLELSGLVTTGAARDVLSLGDQPRWTPAAADRDATAPTRAPAVRRQPVSLHGSQLVVGTRPFLPRAVRHKGQPLSAIKELGFNTVVLNNPVTAEQLKEAAQNELWLVAPPPHVGPGSGTDSLVPSSAHDNVLAWNVSGQGSNGNPDVARGRATSIRRADDQPPRPVLCAAQSGWSDYSRAVDLLVVDAPMPASSERLNLARAHWDNVASQLRPGAPWWATIQIAPIMPSSPPSHPVKGTTGTNASNAVAVRQLVFEAVTAGARGIVFDLSMADLSHPDWHDTAAAIRAINAELQLLEPWIAGGHGAERLASQDPQVALWVLEADRARLVIAVTHWSDVASSPRRRPRPLTFIDGGAPDSADAYLIDGADFRPQRRRRVAGGVEVTVDDVSPVTLVVLTPEPVVVNYLARTLTNRRASFSP